MSDGYLAFYTDHYGATETIAFTPPTIIAGWNTGEFLTTYFSRGERGIAVLRHGTEFTEKRYVTETEIKAADAFYSGGHYYTDISEQEAEYLIDGGYEVTVIEVAP